MPWTPVGPGWHRQAGPFSLWVLPLVDGFIPLVGLVAAAPCSSPEAAQQAADRLLGDILEGLPPSPPPPL